MKKGHAHCEKTTKMPQGCISLVLCAGQFLKVCFNVAVVPENS